METFNSTIKDIHLALEVKTFFSYSTPTTSSSTESNFQSLDFPLMVVNGIAEREIRRNLHTKTIRRQMVRRKKPSRS
jgi:hypothetical protein